MMEVRGAAHGPEGPGTIVCVAEAPPDRYHAALMTPPVNRRAPGGARARASFALALLAALAAPACKCSANKPSAAASGPEQYAVIETSRGPIGVRLLSAEAPRTVENFVDLATGKKEFKDPFTGQLRKAAFYDGLLFHHVTPGFLVQVGDPVTRDAAFGTTYQGTQTFGRTGPGYEFEDELPPAGTKLFEKPCMLAMANHGPNTNGSQFFITEGFGAAVPQLEPHPCQNDKAGVCGFTRFGEGVCGCELVAAIAKAGDAQTRIVKVTFGGTPPTCK
jgi:peptidylprolyl isomerase/peptidyl-prolyl cis-trans isomerase A (cyclophilin A)